MSKLTAKQVEKAPAKSKEYNLSDGAGLFLRVRSTGSKSWIYFFRLPDDRKLHRMTLGSLEDMSLKEARDELPKVRKLVAKGIDPRNERAAEKTENSNAITMQILFDNWIRFVKATDCMSEEWARRHENRWRLHLKKSLGNLLAKDLTRFHLTAVLEKMAVDGIKEETRKALTTLNLMLDYGLKHHIKENPARMLKPKDFNVTANKPRDRALSITELRKLWQALDHAAITPEGVSSASTMSSLTINAIKLLILTGARRAEVAGMSWAELDLNAGVWLLPKGRTKNGLAHTIYLPALAIEIIRTLHLLTGHSKYVFDTGRNVIQAHIHEDTLTAAIARLRGHGKTKKKPDLEQVQFLSDVESFTVHDLRRSAATAWGEHLKTAPHVIEKMLNHQPSNKLVATYQRAVYPDEQKKAWLAWGNLVEYHIVNADSKVVPMIARGSC